MGYVAAVLLLSGTLLFLLYLAVKVLLTRASAKTSFFLSHLATLCWRASTPYHYFR